MSKIRILVADDSSFMRKVLQHAIEGVPEFEFVGACKNGREIIDAVEKYSPDVVTLDIEMPLVNGLDALKEIMIKHPTPVIMVSSLTTEGAEQTIKALELGAVDFIPKATSFTPGSGLVEDLVAKIRAVGSSLAVRLRFDRLRRVAAVRKAAKTELASPHKSAADLTKSLAKQIKTISQEHAHEPKTQHAKTSGRRRSPSSHYHVAVLGVSTGGPLALHTMIPHLPQSLPVPLLIVQHMPPHFTKSLADRLNAMSHVTVREAADGDKLLPGHVYIAPGGKHMVLKDRNTIKITDLPPDTLHKPSVDVTLQSVLDIYAGSVLGIIMTGMGRDGADALANLHRLGGWVIAQDEASCVVYGMPKAVVEAGHADEVVSLDSLPGAICSALNVKNA